MRCDVDTHTRPTRRTENGPARAAGDPHETENGHARATGEPHETENGHARATGEPHEPQALPARNQQNVQCKIVKLVIMAPILIFRSTSISQEQRGDSSRFAYDVSSVVSIKS